jgi:1-acyl-sn-glycerol-3-phosphate acyltransferase
MFLPGNYIRFPAKIWIKGIFIFLKYICGITHEIKGVDKLKDEPMIIVAKHQSAFETFALFYYLPNSIFIHKKQLYWIPIFGQYLLKSNMISIDRKGGAKTMRQMLRQTKEKALKGYSIIIFPEGTRKKPGAQPDYKSGFIGIYKEMGSKILPVALNSGKCWPKHTFLKKPGRITIKILPTIEANIEKNKILKNLEDIIEKETNRII